MRSSTDFLDHSTISSAPNHRGQSRSMVSYLAAAAGHVWTSMLSTLGTTHEPRIWVTHNRDGIPHWHVYDSMSDRHQVLSSEDEVRIYLEERFND